MNRSKDRICLTAIVLSLAAPVLAGEGRIPIWQPLVIGPGQEGKYVLTRDISAPAGGPAIDIQWATASVDIDLNGFTVYGSAGFDLIRAANVDSLTVRNGTLTGGGGDGIHADRCTEVVIEDLKILNVAGAGITLLDADDFAVRRNIVREAAGGAGILVDGLSVMGSNPTRGSIEDNVVEGCASGLSVLNGNSVGIRNNRIHGTTSGDGLRVEICTACLIVDNTINRAAANGMDLDQLQRGSLRGNVVSDSQGGEGIWVHAAGNANLIVGNTINSNANNGLLVDSGRNLIQGNVLCNNGTGAIPSAYGMVLNGYSNVYRGNLAHGNQGPAASCPGTPATNDFCDVTSGNLSPFNQPSAGLAGDNLMPTLL